MSFDVAAALRKSTGRAKSDVANKLVSMFLHDVSRKACAAGGMTVSDTRYTDSVVAAFGHACLYCGKELTDSVVPVVEHLNGMNRISVGLHVPGNVAIACKACNNQKRNDDQKLLLAENGWESFLSHDGSQCAKECKTCSYWGKVWPEEATKLHSLAEARQRVLAFQSPYKQFIIWSSGAKETLRVKIEMLYRDCQRFADEEIKKLVAEANLDFEDSKSMNSKS